MRRIITLSILISASLYGFGQDSTNKSNNDLAETNINNEISAQPAINAKPPKISIFNTLLYGSGKQVVRTYLVKIEDSFIVISQNPAVFNMPLDVNQQTSKVYLPDLQSINIAKQGRVGKGALVGFITGVGVGMIAGAATAGPYKTELPGPIVLYGNLPIGEAMSRGALVGCITGLLIGMLVGGLSSHTYKIKGQKQKLQEMNKSLLEKMYTPSNNARFITPAQN
jgi:hypothetical protein